MPSRAQYLDLNLLRVFAVTYKERNLKRAALQLASTAPSLSIKLSKLKAKMGGELFVKTPTGFEPTELADQLFFKIEPLLMELKDAIDFIDGFDPALIKDPFTIDMGQHFMPWLTPILYKKLKETSPQSHLVANFFSNSSLDRLRKGEIDIGLQASSVAPPKDILEIPIAVGEVSILVRKDHPYPHAQASIKDLTCYDFAVTEQSLYGLDQGGAFINLLQQENMKINVKLNCPSIYAVSEVIKQSDMILPTARNVLHHSSDDFRWIALTDPSELIMRPISAYIHQKNRHNERHKWYVELLKDEMRKATGLDFIA